MNNFVDIFSVKLRSMLMFFKIQQDSLLAVFDKHENW